MIKGGRKKRETVLFVAGLFLSLLLIFSVAGCSAAKNINESANSMDMGRGVPASSAPAPMPEEAYGAEKGEYLDDDSASGTMVQRHIIQNAHLRVEVLDIDEASASLQHLTEQANGYIASREIYNIGDERRAGTVSMRVPAASFNYLLEEIKALGKVKNDRVYTDDVTMQYIDLEARIENMAAQEKRLRELLEQAESVEDIMQVERELGRVRGDLEAMTGNFRYLQERVQYSAIDIHLEEKDARTMVVGEIDGFGERVGALLALNTNRFLTATSNFFIVGIGSLPILIPLLLIVFLFWKAVSINKERKRIKQEREREQKDLSQNQ